MSKSVRLKDHLVAEVERLANEERRSLANMVEILLEQALNLENSGFGRIMDGDEPVGIVFPTEPVTPDLVATSEPVIAKGRRPSECGMSNRHPMNSKLNPCPRCGYPA